MRRLFPILAVTASLLLSGCISTLEVKPIAKADLKTAPGLRYALPATFLLVQPQADGTATYSWVFLPDPDKTYAITKHSFLAKFTLDVATSNGLLTSLQAQGDASGVAAKLFDAAQSVYAAKVGADSKDATSQATSQAAAKAAVSAAKLAKDQADAEKAIVDKDPNATAADKRAAEIKASNAKLALDYAEAAATKAGVSSADAIASTAPQAQQYGPVLFRVMQAEDGNVTLLAVNPQEMFDTVVPAGAGQATPAAPLKFTLKDGQKFVAGKALTIKIVVSAPIESVDIATTTLIRNGTPQTAKLKATRSADGKEISIIIDKGLPVGSYTLTPAVVSKPGAAPVGPDSVVFTVASH